MAKTLEFALFHWFFLGIHGGFLKGMLWQGNSFINLWRAEPVFLDRARICRKNSRSVVCRLRKAFGDSLPVVTLDRAYRPAPAFISVILRQHTTCVASEPAPRHPAELNTDDAGTVLLV